MEIFFNPVCVHHRWEQPGTWLQRSWSPESTWKTLSLSNRLMFTLWLLYCGRSSPGVALSEVRYDQKHMTIERNAILREDEL